VVGQESVVRKTQFPRLVIPLAIVVTCLFTLAVNLVVVLVFILAFGVGPFWTWLLFPLVPVMLIVVTVPVAMIVSSLYPRYRDVSIIWTVLSTALFYGTPIFYTLSVVAEKHYTFSRVLAINPLTPILELARKWMIQPSAPNPVQASGALGVVGPLVVVGVVWLLAVWIFHREAPRIAEQL
jgi:ABC-2 type transport system permease protein